MNIEELARENKLAELAILQQSVQERNERIKELEQRVDVLETLLNRVGGWRPTPLPQLQPAPAFKQRRWAVR